MLRALSCLLLLSLAFTPAIATTPAAASVRDFDRSDIEAIPSTFPQLAQTLTWGQVEFISDPPGKNDGRAASLAVA
ncbi:MAG: hypothetical protein R3E75_00355 [Steroidobacteraceae bacterium]|nr:hypothetical protein [Nevskiaceae bacterium]MCP5339422.1 hypothetical protein [Nevskiaceae bacterium]MCP5472878.1 hypothetical protein [Nevskiaceae bacterium]